MRTRPAHPLVFEPQPAIVDPGAGSAERNVIRVGPVLGPTTTPAGGGVTLVGVGLGVPTTVGVPSPQPVASRIDKATKKSPRGRMPRSSR